MSENVTIAIVTSLSGLGGVVLGFFLTLIKESTRKKKKIHDSLCKVNSLSETITSEIGTLLGEESLEEAYTYLYTSSDNFNVSSILNGFSNISGVYIITKNMTALMPILQHFKKALKEAIEALDEGHIETIIKLLVCTEELESSLDTYFESLNMTKRKISEVLAQGSINGVSQRECEKPYDKMLTKQEQLNHSIVKFTRVNTDFRKVLKKEILYHQTH